MVIYENSFYEVFKCEYLCPIGVILSKTNGLWVQNYKKYYRRRKHFGQLSICEKRPRGKHRERLVFSAYKGCLLLPK